MYCAIAVDWICAKSANLWQEDFSKWKDYIIIKSNTYLYFLRKNINSLGYYIEDEILVEDKNIIYTVIKFNKGKRRYNYKELYLGPVLTTKNDDLFKKKCNKELTTLKLILKNINSGHYLYRLKIKRNIKILEDVLKH